MSTVRSFQAPSNDYNRLQYTQYLEDQLEKLSSFVLYQKKENQKNNQLMRMIEDQNQKIKIINDKIHLFEIYQHQNFKNHTKILDQLQKLTILEKKVQKLRINLYQNRYDCGNLSSKPPKIHDLKNEIQQMIVCEIGSKFKQIQEIMDLKQERLTAKISSMNKQKQTIDQSHAGYHNGQSKGFSKNSTSLRTNQTQNDKSSRFKEIGSENLNNKKMEYKNQKRISSFIPEQHLIDSNRHVISQHVYSNIQKPTDSVVKNKKNNKTKKSKSKSEIKSESSFQLSNLYKQNNKIKKSKKLTNSKEQKIKEREEIKGKKDEPKSGSEDRMKRKKSKEKSINLKSQQNPKRTSYMVEKGLQKYNSKKSNNNSQLSLSQNSIKSKSYSKRSITQQLKNQKQFLMSCNKFHN